jgi:transmembrane protein EpsG
MKYFYVKPAKGKTDTIILFLVFIVLFLVSAFRNGLGTDYDMYANSYNNPAIWKNEFLFKFLFITIPRLICKNPLTFFILTSFVINLFFLKSIFHYSQILLISLLIYITQFYFSSFNVIRQFIVISLFLYFGTKYIINKRYLFYFIFVVFIAQIHFFMYLMLLFPVFGNKLFKLRFYWIIYGVSCMIFLGYSLNFIKLSTLFESLPKLSFLTKKFESYNIAVRYFVGLYHTNYQLIVKNLIFIILLFRLPKFGPKNETIWFNLFLFGIVLQNILTCISLLAVRLAYIGDVALIFLIPIFINSFKLKNNRTIITICFITYFISIFYYRFVLIGESQVFR